MLDDPTKHSHEHVSNEAYDREITVAIAPEES
jgi:hypothetical protein